MSIGTGSAGGFAIPFVLDPSIMLTSTGALNPVRQVARQVTISGAREWRGVASDGVLPNAFDKGLAGQADFLREAYRLVLRNRRRWHIGGLDWFTWQDVASPDPHCVFCQSGGLFTAEGAPKPAWRAFRHVVRATRAGTSPGSSVR